MPSVRREKVQSPVLIVTEEFITDRRLGTITQMIDIEYVIYCQSRDAPV